MKFNAWYLLLLKDSIEIICLSLICYHWLRWLRQDKQKPLLIYFMLYILFWAFCFLSNLTVLTHMLDATMPIVAMLFILMHQKTLQQNFVSLYKLTPAQPVEDHWLELLIRFCLQSEKDFIFLIEHQHALADLLEIPIALQAPVRTSLLNFITGSNTFVHDRYIYLNAQGVILGINVSWQKTVALDEIESNMLIKSSYFLQQTDALVVHYTNKDRSFCLILEGTIYGPLTGQQLLQSVEKYLKITTSKQGVHYAASGKAPAQQPHA